MKKSRILLAAALPLTAVIVYLTVNTSNTESSLEAETDRAWLETTKMTHSEPIPDENVSEVYEVNDMDNAEFEVLLATHRSAESFEELDQFYRQLSALTLEDLKNVRENPIDIDDESETILIELADAKEKAADGDFTALEDLRKKYGVKFVFDRKK